MPEYTLDEIEKFKLNESQQILLFGNTIKEMRQLKPDGKIATWCDIQRVLNCNSRKRLGSTKIKKRV